MTRCLHLKSAVTRVADADAAAEPRLDRRRRRLQAIACSPSIPRSRWPRTRSHWAGSILHPAQHRPDTRAGSSGRTVGDPDADVGAREGGGRHDLLQHRLRGVVMRVSDHCCADICWRGGAPGPRAGRCRSRGGARVARGLLGDARRRAGFGEQWMPPAGGTLLGMSRTVTGAAPSLTSSCRSARPSRAGWPSSQTRPVRRRRRSR